MEREVKEFKEVDIPIWLNNKVDKEINELFIDIAEEYDLESGDITPLQNLKLDEIKRSLKNFIKEWFEQNKNKE